MTETWHSDSPGSGPGPEVVVTKEVEVAVSTGGIPILTRHIGCRLHALDDRTLRCIDHDHTLDLSARPSTARSTSTSRTIPNVNDPNACPTHPGQWAASCSGCRADRIAGAGQ